ncbi:MAG TPA: 1,4-dihydroxy-2-naphthoate polyprenyltransferase [Actinomycetota bacterium]|nr:1,4-dihydroxy-2-naphthoate polyprenyltransferase [Actinomycetota bacterium]
MPSVWLEAIRPKTLSVGVVPVLVGTSAAHEFHAWRVVGALVIAVTLQIGVNLANDYFDGRRGVDTPERTGPRRAVASGLVAPAAMRRAMLGTFATAGIVGSVLAWQVSWLLLPVGALAIISAVLYSGGPRPYASAGLGEVFVFIFFGVVATVGSTFIQDLTVSAVALMASIPVGLLAVAVLMANNLRDIPTDTDAGKMTLAVRLGEHRTRLAFIAILVVSVLMALPVAMLRQSWLPALSLGALPLILRPAQLVWTRSGRDLIPALVGTARLQLVFGLLLSLGLAMSR